MLCFIREKRSETLRKECCRDAVAAKITRSAAASWRDACCSIASNEQTESCLHMKHRIAPLIALAVLTLGGCGSITSTSTVTEKPLFATDAIGTSITLPKTAPQHIIALGATDSEILGALGLDTRVVAVDSFTNYPASFASKPKVTDNNGKPNIEQIVAMKSDLVLSFGGELADADKQLLQNGITVVDLPTEDIAGSLKEIRLVGQLTDTESAANALVASMQHRIDAVTQKVAKAAPVSVYMEIGYMPAPIYAFGGGSFGDALATLAAGKNIFSANTQGGGFPPVSEESIIAANPQVIILTEDVLYGGDPTAVAQRSGWAQIAAVQAHHVYAINPDTIQRPGPRIVDGLEQLAKDLHPELFP